LYRISFIEWKDAVAILYILRMDSRIKEFPENPKGLYVLTAGS
jgi:hypothetical protein